MSRTVPAIDPDSPGGLAAADSLSQTLAEIYAGIAQRQARARAYGPRPPAAPQTPPPPAGPPTPSKRRRAA